MKITKTTHTNQIDAPIRQKPFHDAHLWMILFVFFLAVAAPFQWHTIVTWAILLCIVALIQSVPAAFCFKSFGIAFGLSISIWLLNVFFHEDPNAEQALIKANQIALKVWAMTWVALLSSKMTNPRDVITYALQRGWLSVTIAYATLVGLGSIELMQNESSRIRLNAKLRGFTNRQRFLQWIPLLIFALRHAQRGAMSLRARGLNRTKNFYYNYQPTCSQTVKSTVLLIIITLTTLYNELP